MAVIFDLDQTLIDSQPIEPLRRLRRWAEVYPLIPQLRAYEGISELLIELRAKGIPICIVTASPRPYCERVIASNRWRIDATVCYHDTTKWKPEPDPILEGVRRLGVNPEQTLAVGDAAKDIIAARRAKVVSIGALWGAVDQRGLLSVQPDLVCQTVADLRTALLARLAL